MRNFFLAVATAALVFSSGGQAQNSTPASDASKSTIRVGVALPTNQSLVAFAPIWERAQLVRFINRDQGGKGKKGITIEAVALHASSMEDLAEEAQQEKCGFVVLVTAIGPQDRIADDNVIELQPNEVVKGNSLHRSDLQINYEVRKIGVPEPIAQGMVIANGTDDQGQPMADWNNSIRNAMDPLAVRVIRELRKQHVSGGD